MTGIFEVTDLVASAGGEPRMSAALLAERLGMARKQGMTYLIERNEASLRRFGELIRAVRKDPAAPGDPVHTVCKNPEVPDGFSATVAKNPSARGGRPSKDYLLNEGQAIYIASRSETALADQVLIALVMVFLEYRHGRLAPVVASADMREISTERLLELLQSENELLRSKVPAPRPKRKASVPLTDDERQEILRLSKAGLSGGQIARVTGRSRATISLLLSGFRVIDGGVE